MKEYPVIKNQQLTVEIIDLTHEGLGVAKIDHYPLFIENALPGEIVEIQVVKTGSKFGYGKVLSWEKESEDRIPVKDTALLRTGIAPLSHMTYGSQLLFKQNQVQNVMNKVAKMPDVPVLPTIGAAKDHGYRNKAQIPVRKVEDRLTTGFYRKNSHDLLPIEDFYIQDPEIDRAILVIRDILRRFSIKPYSEAHNSGFLRHLIIRRGYYSHQMMVTLVTRTEKFFKGKALAKQIVEELPEVVSVIQNVNPDKTNVILGQEEIVLYGEDHIEDQLLGKTYQISSQSFYQVNTPQAELLYQTAIEYAQLDKEDIVIDAYCGIGTIGLSLAERVKKVYGVEVVPKAIEDARKNAEQNNIENVSYEVGQAEDAMKKWSAEGITPSVIIVDPPRKGLTNRFIEASAEVSPERIIYVSCNPATLARDLKLYKELGYETEKIQPVDLFPQTHHVECVALLTKVV